MAINRRQFIASTSLAGAAPAIFCSAVLGADNTAPGERVNIGIIGCGSRGYNLIDEFLGHPDCQIVAVCDVDKHHYRDRVWGQGTAFGLLPAREKIQSAYAKKAEATDKGLQTYADFRELIARDDIDAVVVATPDHWHALCTLQAIVAGKDVYCEKPITHLFAEGQQIYRAAEQHNTVFQTGSQQRSDAQFRRAVEIARNGLLGTIRRVEVGLPPGYDRPQGDAAVVKVPKQLDYDFWCGPSPMLPYMRARHHRWWRGHRAYGGGVLMDWIGHHNDIAHWALDVDQRGPDRVEATEWSMPATNIYNTPHHYTIRCIYPGGIESTISSRNEAGLKLIGEDGWVFVNRGVLKASDDRWLKPDFQPGDLMVYRSDNHTRNFLDCVKSRNQCIAPAETAHRSITPGHLAYVSAELDRPLDWDPQTETVTGDSEANMILQTVHYREPWNTA